MANQYVNKVVQSNGTTLIDISDTTAVAADVATGKYFYLATGEKIEGTGSSGGGAITQDANGFLVLDDEGGGGGPDLSSDTVTADTLLHGITAHNSSGTAITGTLTGTDFMAATLTINVSPDVNLARYSTYGIPVYNENSKLISCAGRFLDPDAQETVSYTYKIPTGSYFFIAIVYMSSAPAVEFSNLSSGITLLNNGVPISVGNANYYVIRVNGSSSSTRSFTISRAVEE